MTRAVIRIPSVHDVQRVAGGIGCLRLSHFTARSARELGDTVAGLQREGVKGLVIDLRGNPGGLLESAVSVCGLFLPAGSVVAWTEGRTPDTPRRHVTRGRPRFPDLPLALLIDGNSASAAEVVAGCLQDHRRAVLGAPTFGKGSVQTVSELPGNRGLRLTTQYYLTPDRRKVEGIGIRPDTPRVMPADPVNSSGHEPDGSAGTRAPPPLPLTDPVLRRAVEQLSSAAGDP